ncbi:hypothetical protein OG301_39440 (plasmid) [Streptomyces platensis]|uniref:hypothetical protein n=1 Tax=Streptomyces platensis TaxID=58346 RepID=UPI002ED1DEE8|nr:hypothetical protein OG301_39440 [Streptomyces platensis]
MPPKRRDHQQQRELLAQASEKLKAMNEESLAEGVAYALTDNYVDAAIYHRREKDRKSTNLNIGFTKAIREHLHAAAEAGDTNLSAVANEALRAFLDGTFTPQRAERAAYGSVTDEAANINVRLDKDLSAQARRRCKALADELGWTPNLTQVIKQYLLLKFPLPDSE